MTDEQRAARGAQAEREWAQVAEAFERVREAIVAEWAQTGPANTEKLTKLHMAVQILAAVKAAVLAVVDDGQMARAAITQAGLTRN